MSFAKCYFFFSNPSNLKFSHLSSFFLNLAIQKMAYIDTDRVPLLLLSACAFCQWAVILQNVKSDCNRRFDGIFP